jgi:hypothetical protein
MNILQLTPTDLTQEAVTDGMPWNIADTVRYIDRQSISTSQPLKSIFITNYNSGKPKITVSNKLILTNMAQTISGTITGISVHIESQRASRILDLVVQLTYNGNLIGDNKAILDIISDSSGAKSVLSGNNSQDYGSENDLWGTALTPNMINDPSFGIVIQFSSHLLYPCSDIAYIEYVSITGYSV